MFNRILLAVDGSEHAVHAAKVAAELAHRMKSAELRIVTAYDPIPPYLGEPNLQVAIDSRLIEAQEILKRAVELVGDSNVDVHTELIEGNPAEAICGGRPGTSNCTPGSTSRSWKSAATSAGWYLRPGRSSRC